MAVATDYDYLRSVISAGLVGSSVLELGGRSWQGEEGNAASVCAEHGIGWTAADIEPGPGVEHVLDILNADDVAAVGRTWPTVLLFNLLEHVYDPVTAMRHTLALTEPGGTVVVLGPAIWELHDYPADYWRPMPDFFTEFARREGATVVGDPTWVFNGRLLPVSALTVDGQKQFPHAWRNARQVWPRARLSFLVQKGLSTVGRWTPFPPVALGVVLRRG